MKFYNINKRKLNKLIVTILICVWTTAVAQVYKIEEIQLVNMGNYYRIFIQSTGPMIYTSKFKETPPQLVLYIRDTKIAQVKKNHFYENAYIKKILTSQWKKSPAIVKITIILERSLKYEITAKMNGLIYVDLMKPNFSKSFKSPRNQTESRQENNGKFDAITEKSNNEFFDNSAENSHASNTNYQKDSHLINDASPKRLPAPLTSDEFISLDVKAAEISNVLRLLAKQTNLNIVASKDVSGKVTVSLANVSVKEALDMIAKANGYDYIIDGDVILVKPPDKFQLEELRTKVYRLKYIDANNLKNTLTEVLTEKAKIQVFNYDFQPAVEEKQNPAKKPKNRSSTVIVTDVPANFKQIEAMIEALDRPTPQIMIEAKLIEIAPMEDEKIGIDWSKTINAEIFKEVLLPSGKPYRYSADAPLEGGNINFGTLKFNEYNAVLDFLNTNTNSKLVSNPRILAMDNHEAIISVGTNFPVPQINRGVGGQGDVVTFEYRDVNISLRVTPHVAEDQTISLFVNPVIEEVTGEVIAGDSRAPITSKREVETVVNLKSNETMVIGGLIKESTIETKSKVWLLGDIPLIGNIFRHTSKSKRQTDLLIFITPRLIE